MLPQCMIEAHNLRLQELNARTHSRVRTKSESKASKSPTLARSFLRRSITGSSESRSLMKLCLAVSHSIAGTLNRSRPSSTTSSIQSLNEAPEEHAEICPAETTVELVSQTNSIVSSVQGDSSDLEKPRIELPLAAPQLTAESELKSQQSSTTSSIQGDETTNEIIKPLTEMFVICPDALRSEVLSLLTPSGSEGVYSSFPVLPKQKNVLVATEKVDDENVRAAVRHFLVNADGWPKLVVAKKHWDTDSTEQMEQVVQNIRERATQICETAIQKTEKLPSGEWKDDRMEQLGQWKDVPSVEYGTVDIGSTMQQNLKEILPQFQPFEMAHGDNTPINSKPPVLHWPPEPLDGEIQVILRVTFPISGPDECTFRELCRNLRQYGEHVYEWTTGILTTTDAVRLHVDRVKSTVIQISGRLSVDELEGAAAEKPMSQMWPYLAVALKEILAAVQHLQNMPYIVDLIPYGSDFYSPPIESRVFELTQFMATANAYNKVATRVDGEIHEVDMNLLLPEGPFTSLASLLALEPPTTRMSRASSMQEAATKDEVTPLDTGAINGGLTVSHNKGRRVSFGSIKLMNEAAAPIVGDVDAFVDGIVKESMNLKSLYVD